MPSCWNCGEEIVIRYMDGVPTPVHLNGGWCNAEPKTTTLSYVNPNALCPVCGDKVFFYRSPHNGRVFFDELGPTWPKHPCTDNSFNHFPRTIQGSEAKMNQAWQKQGWRPFDIRNIKLNKETGLRKISGFLQLQTNLSGTYAEIYIGSKLADLEKYPLLVKRKVFNQGCKCEVATFRLTALSRELEPIFMDGYLKENRIH